LISYPLLANGRELEVTGAEAGNLKVRDLEEGRGCPHQRRGIVAVRRGSEGTTDLLLLRGAVIIHGTRPLAELIGLVLFVFVIL